MDNIEVGDILVMKKDHPCGVKRWKVTRTGADIRMVCQGCGHEVMLPLHKVTKSIRSIEKGSSQ